MENYEIPNYYPDWKDPRENTWSPPKGWFQAAIKARQDREDLAFRIEDNKRRQEYGLPTYEI